MSRSKDVMVRLPVEIAEAIEKEAKNEGLTLATKARSMIVQYKNLKDNGGNIDSLIIEMRDDFRDMNKKYDKVFQKMESIDNSIKDLAKTIRTFAEGLMKE